MYQGKNRAIQGKELRPPLHFSVIAIEKGSFWSPSTKGRQLYFTLVLKQTKQSEQITLNQLFYLLKDWQKIGQN